MSDQEPLNFPFVVGDGLSAPAKSMDSALGGLEERLGSLDQILRQMETHLRRTGSGATEASRGIKKTKEEAGALAVEFGKIKGIDLGKLWEGMKGGGLVGGLFTFDLAGTLISAAGTVKDTITGMWEGLAHAVEMAAELGAKVLDAGAKSERLRVSFDLLGKGGEGGRQLEYLDKIAGHGSFDDDDLAKAARPLTAAGFKVDDLKYAITAATDMEAFLGGGAATISEVLNVFKRVKTTGKLEGRGLKELGIASGGVFAGLGKELGVSSATAEELAEAGKIPADQLLHAIYKAIAAKGTGRLGDATERAADTVAVKLEKLKALPENYYKAIASSEGFGKFSDFLTNMLEKFDPSGPVGTRIIAGLTRIGDRILGLFGDVDDEAIDRVVDGVLGFVDALVTAAPLVANMIANLARLADMGVRAFESYRKIVGGVGEFLGGGPAKGASGFTEDEEARLYTLWKRSRATGAATSQGVAAGIDSGAAGVDQAAGELGAQVDDAIRTRLKVRSPSGVGEEIGEMVGAGLGRGMERSAASVREAAAGAFGPSIIGGGGGAGRGLGGGPIQVGPFFVTVEGGGVGADLVERLEEKLRPSIRAEVLALFEEYSQQTGSAS